MLLDPGLGKTSTVLGAYTAIGGRMLVIAPIKPMYDTWPGEVEKWDEFAHLKVSVLHGPGREERIQDDADIHVINPEGLAWFFADDHRPQYEVLCIDESTKFKRSVTQRFKLLKARLHEFPRRWILTGTVVPNGLLDLFGQVFIMDMGITLGKSYHQYKQVYFYAEGYGGYTYRPREGALEVITKQLSEDVLTLRAEDYLEMPELVKVERMCTLPDTAAAAYAKVEKSFILELAEGTLVAANAAVAGNKCRQIANGLMYLTDEETGERQTIAMHDEKMKELMCLVEETNGHPLLIFYEYQHDKLCMLAELGKGAVCLTGATGARLNAILKDFNSGKIRYLLAHPGSVHGLNVQGHCFHMIWYGLPWNLEHYVQAVWRLYRQGQSSKTVYCYHILGKDTLDEVVSKVLIAKEATQDKLLEALKGE